MTKEKLPAPKEVLQTNMKISDIYQKFKLPPNLQEHMLRVAAIVEYLEKYWTSEVPVNWNLVLKAALLHDLGNIIKFDLDNHPEFLGAEQENLEYWKSVQAEMVRKYGDNDERATQAMLAELGVDGGLAEIIFNKRFDNSVEVERSNDWVLKILYYADLRTLPFGIGSIEDRIGDARARMPQYTNRPDFEELVIACLSISRQIEEKLSIPASQINDKNVRINEELLKLEIKRL